MCHLKTHHFQSAYSAPYRLSPMCHDSLLRLWHLLTYLQASCIGDDPSQDNKRNVVPCWTVVHLVLLFSAKWAWDVHRVIKVKQTMSQYGA